MRSWRRFPGRAERVDFMSWIIDNRLCKNAPGSVGPKPCRANDIEGGIDGQGYTMDVQDGRGPGIRAQAVRLGHASDLVGGALRSRPRARTPPLRGCEALAAGCGCGRPSPSRGVTGRRT